MTDAITDTPIAAEPIITVIGGAPGEDWDDFADAFEAALLLEPGARRVTTESRETFVVAEITMSRLEAIVRADEKFGWIVDNGPEECPYVFLIVDADDAISAWDLHGFHQFTLEHHRGYFTQIFHAALPDRFAAPVYTVLGSYCAADGHDSYDAFEAAFMALPGAREVVIEYPLRERDVRVSAQMTRSNLEALIDAHPDFAAAISPVGPDEVGSTYGLMMIDADHYITMYSPVCESVVNMPTMERANLLWTLFPETCPKPDLPEMRPVPNTYERMRAQTRDLMARRAA